MADKSESTEKKPAPRSVEDIQSDIDETRERLVDNIAQLKEETSPRALADRAKRTITGVFVDPETGSVRTERVAAVAAVVVGLIVIRRGLKSRARKQELRRLSAVVWVPVPKASVSAEFAPVARSAAELSPQLALAAAG